MADLEEILARAAGSFVVVAPQCPECLQYLDLMRAPIRCVDPDAHPPVVQAQCPRCKVWLKLELKGKTVDDEVQLA